MNINTKPNRSLVALLFCVAGITVGMSEMACKPAQNTELTSNGPDLANPTAGQAYFAQAIPAIFANLDQQAVLARASDDLKQTWQGDELQLLLQEWATLGAFRSFEPCDGLRIQKSILKNVKDVRGEQTSDRTLETCTTTLQFEKSAAELRMMIVQNPQNPQNQWSILVLDLKPTQLSAE